MGKLKQYWLVTGLVIVAMLGAGYFFGMQPQTAKATKVKAATAEQVAANAKLNGEIAILQKQAEGVLTQENRLRQITIMLPSSPALPSLVRALSTATQATGVDLSSLSPGQIAPIAAPVVEPVKAAKPAAADAATATGDATAAKKAPVVAAPDLYSMPVALVLSGDFTQLQMFLTQLEKMPRSFVVDSLTVAPNAPAGPTATAAEKKLANALAVTVNGHVFIKPPTVVTAPAKAPAAAATQK